MYQLILDFVSRRYPGFDSFLGTSNDELLHILQQQSEQFVYVWGQPGSGKSHLLRAWVAQAEERGAAAAYIDAASEALTERALEAEYLAVDQIEKLNPAEQALLFEIFNRARNSGSGFLLSFSDGLLRL